MCGTDGVCGIGLERNVERVSSLSLSCSSPSCFFLNKEKKSRIRVALPIRKQHNAEKNAVLSKIPPIPRKLELIGKMGLLEAKGRTFSP